MCTHQLLSSTCKALIAKYTKKGQGEALNCAVCANGSIIYRIKKIRKQTCFCGLLPKVSPLSSDSASPPSTQSLLPTDNRLKRSVVIAQFLLQSRYKNGLLWSNDKSLKQYLFFECMFYFLRHSRINRTFFDCCETTASSGA